MSLSLKKEENLISWIKFNSSHPIIFLTLVSILVAFHFDITFIGNKHTIVGIALFTSWYGFILLLNYSLGSSSRNMFSFIREIEEGVGFIIILFSMFIVGISLVVIFVSFLNEIFTCLKQ